MEVSPAGPSRLPTISTEDEELAAEAGVSVPFTGSNGEANGHSIKDEKLEGSTAPEGSPATSVAKPDQDALPEGACETLYIQNLNEKVQVEVLKHTLQNLFKPYRPVLPIVAHRNLRMRGQAFVSFPDAKTADKALKEVNEFPLYGKAMQIKFARSKSDSVVKRSGGDEALEDHKKQRLTEKKQKRRDNPLRRKTLALLKAGDQPDAAAPSKKARVAVPDEYLPPNSILFVQNLPEGTTSDDLREVFELHPGLVEIRTIPAKKDIAFVEYADEAAATVAKDILHNFKIDGETKMKVTYAKR